MQKHLQNLGMSPLFPLRHCRDSHSPFTGTVRRVRRNLSHSTRGRVLHQVSSNCQSPIAGSNKGSSRSFPVIQGARHIAPSHVGYDINRRDHSPRNCLWVNQGPWCLLSASSRSSCLSKDNVPAQTENPFRCKVPYCFNLLREIPKCGTPSGRESSALA